MKNPNLFRCFLLRGCVVFLLLLVVASKCDKSHLEEDLNSCETRGFDVIFAEEDHKRAFQLESFKRDERGNVAATLNVDLSQLTRENGFVAGHMWIAGINPLATEAKAGDIFFNVIPEEEGALSFGAGLLSPNQKWDGVIDLAGMHRGGVAAAEYREFLPADKVTPGEEWLGQAVERKAKTPFKKSLGKGEHGDEMGKKGWQELFIIAPCRPEMSRGFSFATLIDAEDKGDLSLSYFKKPTPQAVTVRVDAAKNSSLIFVDSFVSAGFSSDTGKNAMGLFTVRHYAKSVDQDGEDLTIPHLDKKQNALTTRGALVCRSVINLYPEAKASYLNDAEAKEAVGSLLEASFGEGTGEKKLGLKCYLGLTALWPHALENVTKVEVAHQKQFQSAAKSYPNRYDVSDKHMMILMLDTGDIPINNDLLSPIFGDVLSNDELDGLSKEEGKVLLEKLIESEEFSYLLGRIHIKFNY